jgi:hypothetical protein
MALVTWRAQLTAEQWINGERCDMAFESLKPADMCEGLCCF